MAEVAMLECEAPTSGWTAGGGLVRGQVGILQELAERRLDVRAGIDKVEYGVLDRAALRGEITVRCRLELRGRASAMMNK